jgi:hypothetical protein
MTLDQIKKTYRGRWVVAYACKIAEATLYGGCVIAVQEQADPDYSELKKFRNRFAKQHADKNPIYCFCVDNHEGTERMALTYDNGVEAKKVFPSLRVEKSKAEEALDGIPEDFLAEAIKASIKP